jgi:type IV pilus assembly protein PilW
MKGFRNDFDGGFARQRGVTLVELMVALVLGLVVSGAALALFATNRQTYVASENMERIQESSRIAFELMARDLREADGNPCSNEIALNNGLNGFGGWAWWSDWGAGMQGYSGTEPFPDAAFGTAERDRVDGTPAVEVWTAKPTGSVLTAAMGTTSDDLTVSNTSGIATNDLLVICDYLHGTIFQATDVAATKIEHHASGTPGNANATLPPDVYGPNAMISKLHVARWYIGYNGRTDRDGNLLTSLYRTTVTDPTNTTPAADEIVEGVTGMTLAYHLRGGGAYNAVPANWDDIDAVQIGLTLASRDQIGTEGQVVTRDYQHVVAVRSRAP